MQSDGSTRYVILCHAFFDVNDMYWIFGSRAILDTGYNLMDPRDTFFVSCLFRRQRHVLDFGGRAFLVIVLNDKRLEFNVPQTVLALKGFLNGWALAKLASTTRIVRSPDNACS